MMVPERPTLERRVRAALDGSAGGGPRIPVVLGGCGTGRTSLLLRLRDLIGRTHAQYVDVEAIATTPERFLDALRTASPFPGLPAYAPAGRPEAGAREAFDATLAFLDTARAPGMAPATFVLDEFLELRTFESFPGLRSVLRDLLGALASSGNRFVLTTLRSRAHRRSATPLAIRDHQRGAADCRRNPGDAAGARRRSRARRRRGRGEAERRHDELARWCSALSDGRPSYARAIAETATTLASRGTADPVGALAALLAPGGQLAQTCRFCYELRLHRARGYGALKAILEVLAQDEPLTLTEIAHRLRRTPGSTKDYLSWLEDVDLIVSRQKRYSFADPMLRLWVRLHCHGVPPAEEDITRELHEYVMARLPHAEPSLALAGTPAERDKYSGIIEID